MIDSDLLRYNINSKKFIVFDYEGDLNTFYSTPFQLGFNIYHGTKLIESFDYYIKWPNLVISDFVKKYAHYNPTRMEKSGKDPIEVFTKFGQFINDENYHPVGANIFGFDCLLTYNCLKRLGMKHSWDFMYRSYDVNALFKGYKLDIKPPKDNFFAYQLSMNVLKQRGLKSNVAFVAKELGVNYDPDRMHDGSYDCEIIAKNFFELIKKIDIR